MDIIERQTTLGQSLYEINTNAIKELVALQRDNAEKYLEANREFGARFPEVTDVTGFVGLQREYGETLWGNARGAFEAQSGIIQSALKDAGEAVKAAFEPEEAIVSAEAPKPKAKAKPKTRAKAKSARVSKTAA